MLTNPGVVASLAVLQGLATGLTADVEGDSCPPGTFFNGSGCVDEQPPSDDDEGHLTGCSQDDPFVDPAPCQIGGYDFVPSFDRYLRSLRQDENELHRPPDGPLSYLGYWTGDPGEGWIYEWRKLAGWAGGIHWGDYGYMWLADAPGGPAAVVVDPEAVAQAILDGMEFEPVDIGLAPRQLEQDSDSIGLVGAPVWMWVTNEGPTTWGPLAESVTQGGITVTVTAEVEDIRWDMGDGGSKTCTSTGQEYQVSFGVRNSPNCGYRYEQTSSDQPGTAYEVSATTNWTASWTATSGASGTLEVEPLTSAVHARIGERQVIEVG